MASRPILPKPPKPDTNETARKTAAAWNAPGGGYEQFKKADPQREKALPPGGKLPSGSTPGNYPMPIKGIMHDGGEVPKTGAYLMKKGEHVLTPEKKTMMHHAMSLASTALSHPDEKEPEPPKKTIKSMHIRKAGGGYIIEHHHAAPHLHPMEEHTVKDMDSLHDHLGQHMGEPNESAAHEGAESSGVQAMEAAVGYK
jgi:hypothetical protein